MPTNDPPRADGNIELVKTRLAVVRADPNRERLTIEWRRRQHPVDVIDVPVAALYYNPDTHRIRAQRGLDPAREIELESAPWSDASQAYLHKLLRGDPSDPEREDPDFRALKDDIREHGQNDPGLITPTGVLVNGNTRRAALHELGQVHIRVGVLPDDWNYADVRDVELALQLRKEYRRDYSFINFLLAVDEQVGLGRSPNDIMRDFRIKMPTFERARWLLGFIRDAIDRSREGSTALRFVDFERDQGKLEELYRAYTTLKPKDPDGAEVMRELRLAALVLDFSKTDLRLVQPDFADRYLDDWAKGHDDDHPGDGVAVPGLSVAVPDESVAAKRAASATTEILRLRAKVVNGASAEADTAATQVAATRQSFENGLDLAGRDVRLKKRQLAAPDRLNDAADLVDTSIEELVTARASGALDEDAFDESLVTLRRSLTKLAQHAARSIAEPGPGLAWLVAATASVDS